MLNLLKVIRYFVFVVFVICNAIITSVAIWNLSIIESIASDLTTKQLDSFLIFVGASGLLLMFTIIFFELYGKNVFIGRVWFELAWIGLFCIMELVGAAIITAQSSSQTCDPSSGDVPVSSQDSPCASTQVLQAFTWILAILLLGYLTLLSILTLVKRRDDPTIWHCSVRRFPLMTNQSLKSPPLSPLPRFRSKTPIIVAPTPRRAAVVREPILSYRSGLSLEYEIEHYQAAVAAFAVPEEPAISPVPVVAPTPLPRDLERPFEQVQQPAQPASLSPFYHSAVQSALEDRPNQPQAPPPAHLTQIRKLPPSPPPLGDWPRLDATARPRVKRKPLPQPVQSQPESSLLESQSHPQPQPQPQPQPRRQPRPLPPPQPRPTTSSSYTFDAPALAAALRPIASQSWRSKPSGPRRKSDSIDDDRPTALDLSGISTFRSPGFS